MTPPPAAAAAPAVRPRRTARPVRAPRRVSGPARARTAAPGAGTAGARGGALALPAPGGLALGALQSLSDLAQHRWLDRLIRGRTWIALVAFALIGIVAMQLWIVKLGVGIGRALETEGRLQRENAALSVQNAQASSGERIEKLAAARGMVAAAPGSQRFLHSHGGLDARRAAAALAHAGSVQVAGTATTTTAAASSTEASAAGSETTAASGGETAASGAASSPGSEGEAAASAGAERESSSAAASATTAPAASGSEEQSSSGTAATSGGSTASSESEASATATGATSTEGGTGPGG